MDGQMIHDGLVCKIYKIDETEYSYFRKEDLFVCTTCACLVGDMAMHSIWHYKRGEKPPE